MSESVNIRMLKFGHLCFLFLIGTMLLCACSSPSVLIHSDDPTFADAQNRIDRTIKTVQEIKPPPAESILFLQAESFYRYRFDPPSRSSKSFFAEAAAAITDFPAFQSLAGSLDLFDLRVRAPDASVQLWETFLLKYPNTKLRPLTLYRLGWAYRNVSVPGLPRETPDEPFGQLIKEQPSSSLAKVAEEARKVPWKSKSKAANWSLIPGAGQLYVGETGNGLTRLGIGLAAATAIIVPIVIASQRGSDLNWNHDWPLLATGLGGLIVLSFDYTSSYEDAMRGVLQWNERAEKQFNDAHPEAP